MDIPTLIRILVPELRGQDGRRQIHVVFHQPYTELAEPVRRVLDGLSGAVVIEDRRSREDRRRRFRPVPFEWRGAERRRRMEPVADIVIE